MDNPETKPKKSFLWLRVLVLLIIILGAAYYARYYTLQHGSTSQQVFDNLSVFEVRLKNIESTIPLHEKRIADLEDKLKSAPPALPATAAGAADNKSEERIARLEKELAAMQSSPSSAAPLNNEQILQTIRLLSTFHHFSNKVMSGKPFAIELSALNDELGKDESIEKTLTPLLPYADTGIPTFATLLASFDQSLEQLHVLEATPPAGLSLWERFVYNLEHLVHIRKADESLAGNSTDAILGRAEAHLDAEEIEAAVAEISQLPENDRSAFTTWAEDAVIVTATPGIIDNLEEKVMQKSFHVESSPSAATSQKP